jgi:PAS domain S-box-containing protein
MLTLIAVVVIIATAVGFPAVWVIRSQLNQQAWTQIYQGEKTTQALYQAQQNQINNLALLTSQRPTIQELFVNGDQDDLLNYLKVLQNGTLLDLIAICDSGQDEVTSTIPLSRETLCRDFLSPGFHAVSQTEVPQLWLSSASPIPGWEKDVIVGVRIDGVFLMDMKEKTGLEHIVWVGDNLIANSLFSEEVPLVRSDLESVLAPIQEIERGYNFNINGTPYISTQFQLAESDFAQAEIMLSISDIQNTQIKLLRILLLSIAAIVVVVSLIGVLIARQISRPLVQLADIADDFSQDNLSEAVKINTSVWEISQVANALENARRDLLETMTYLRLEKRWVEHLLASIVEGIITLDSANMITFFSPGAEKITGWESRDILNRDCDLVFLLPESNLTFSQVIPKPGQRQNIDVVLADGKNATLAVTGAELTPVEMGDDQVALVFRDISDEYAIHRLLGIFISNIAHEFKTPLSALLASIELLHDTSQDLSGEELQELLSSLHLGIVSLQTFVDNLLESASIEAGQFKVSPRRADLGKIIASAVSTMQPLMKKYNQYLNVDLPAEKLIVRADQRRIVQVLVNLLSNAIKYGPDQGRITIKVETMDKWVKVKVIDQGPGIPVNKRNLIFQRFVRLDSAESYSDVGAGLGLSVVNEIIKAHGGEVQVENQSQGGAVFSLTLPLYEEGD